MIDLHHTDEAPAAIGPYAQAVSVGGFLFTSGQIPLDPKTGEIVAGGFERAGPPGAHQPAARAGRPPAAASRKWSRRPSTSPTSPISPPLNALYGEAMGPHRPARSTVQVAALPKGARVEIDLVAKLP